MIIKHTILQSCAQACFKFSTHLGIGILVGARCCVLILVFVMQGPRDPLEPLASQETRVSLELQV